MNAQLPKTACNVMAILIFATIVSVPTVLASTIATEQAILTPDDGTPGSFFGWSVSASGDSVIVGAPYADGNDIETGSAYIFTRSSGVWTQEAKLIAGDGVYRDFFGSSVSLSGETAVIGAYGDDDRGGTSGSAYVFVRYGGAWTHQAKLTAADGAASDLLGYAVAVAGDTVVAGAYGDNALAGSAYVFTRSGAVWTQEAKLTAGDGAATDSFGFAVSVAGDTIVVGAYHDDDAGTNSGSAYVFVRSGGVWTQQAKLIAADGAVGDEFGRSVSVAGDTIVVGAAGDDDAGTNSGSAYVFVRSGGVWTQQAKLTAADPVAYAYFGGSVSVAGDTVVVGALGAAPSGSAYVFTRSDGVWTQQGKLIASDGISIGAAVSVAGSTAAVASGMGSESFAYIYVLGPTDSDGDGIADSEDACPAENASGFDADGDGCLDSLLGLRQMLETLVDQGVIAPEMETSLLAKVDSATKSTDKENICAAVNELQAFENQIDAQTGKKISSEAADLILSYGDNVISQLVGESGESSCE